MNGTVRDLLTNLTTLQASLAITDPAAMSVPKAYRYFPDPQKDLPVRSFLNEWSMAEMSADQSHRTEPYQIRTQFIAGQDAISDVERAEDIASAFWAAYVEAIASSVKAGGLFEGLILRLRGAEPTLGLIQRGGKSYVGFECFLAVDLMTAFDWR